MHKGTPKNRFCTNKIHKDAKVTEAQYKCECFGNDVFNDT